MVACKGLGLPDEAGLETGEEKMLMNHTWTTLDACIRKGTTISLLAVAVGLGTTRMASAQVCGGSSVELLSQLQDYANGFKSDATGNPQVVAEQVVIATDVLLSSVTVWGGFGNNSTSNNFTLVVHTDSGGLPGGVVYAESGISTSLVATGVTFPPPLIALDEYEATLTPAVPVTLPAGVVWFEIFNDSPGSDPWYWLTGTLDPQNGIAAAGIAFTAPGGTWHNLGLDQAMVVCGEPIVTGTALCFGDGSGTPCPCGNLNDGSLPEAGCANGQYASGAMLTASGLASLSNDTVVLIGEHTEHSQSGLYFQANDDLSPGIIWGDGLQCAGGQLKRLGVRFSDGTGYSDTSAWTTPISVRAGNVSAGDTKYYQLWYRNPLNSPCGSEFNASNGYMITWVP